MATKRSTRAQTATSDPSAEVDAQLARYRAMRDFSTTAEPSGGSGGAGPSGQALPFVIQKHAATRLHYDFRLGWHGVLKSWACAKGPSYSTHDKRLAVQVEDHPMEYGGFEGTIPKGQYGGGTVLVWDQGTWEPLPGHDFDEGLRKGAVKFTLHGHKLEGRWTLVRMGGRAANESKPNWLLIKEHDGNERPPEAPAITDEAPDSVVTGRSLEAIAAAEDHVWNSRPAQNQDRVNRAPANHSRLQQKLRDAHLHGTTPHPPAKAEVQVADEVTNTTQATAAKEAPPRTKSRSSRPAKSPGKATVGEPALPSAATQAKEKPSGHEAPAQQSTAEAWLAGAPLSAMPPFIAPQLATPAALIPPGSGWLHELKLDGYRVQVHIETAASGRSKPKRKATLYTRSGLDWTHRMRAAAHALESLPVDNAVLDGELVALDSGGQPSFSKLQAAFEKGEAATLTYFAFDLLYLDGHDLRGVPLRFRKTLLEPLVVAAADPLVVYSQHLELAADQVYAHACELGAEGILSKQAEARYASGRSDSWLKLKCTRRQEFVICGFTLPKDKGLGLGSLLLGYYRDGALIHCGRCGTGFTQTSARTIRQQLEPLRQPVPAYSDPLPREARKDALWLRPELVCEVQFATWTADGSIRHASFQGMRTDKPADEVVKEEPVQPRPDDDRNEDAAPRPVSDQPKPSGQAAAVRVPIRKAQAASRAKPAAVPKVSLSADRGTELLQSAATDKTAKAATQHTAKAARPDAAQAAAKLQPTPAKAPFQTRLTHPDKVLDPTSGTTKQQLAEYLYAVAPLLLPHLSDRPVSIVRCPNGTGKPCFFQKHAGVGLPASLGSIAVPDRDNPTKTEPYITVDTAEGLVALAQLGVLELHPWGSRAASLEQPDRLILDLDPDESLPWATLVESAFAIRAFLRELGLESFVKTTGGKGLHIVCAIQPSAPWPDIRLFARGLAAAIESSDPKLYLIKMTKAARKCRIFVDWMRNERGATAVAPWSPRARPGMRCAVPLSWDELRTTQQGPPAFAVVNYSEWRARTMAANDPWAAMRPQTLDPAVLETVLSQTADGTASRSAPRSRR